MVGHNFGKVAGVNLCGFDSRLLRRDEAQSIGLCVFEFWRSGE